jgi:hypothetical protein
LNREFITYQNDRGLFHEDRFSPFGNAEIAALAKGENAQINDPKEEESEGKPAALAKRFCERDEKIDAEDDIDKRDKKQQEQPAAARCDLAKEILTVKRDKSTPAVLIGLFVNGIERDKSINHKQEKQVFEVGIIAVKKGVNHGRHRAFLLLCFFSRISRASRIINIIVKFNK